MTKKLISVVLFMAFLIGLCSCGKYLSKETTDEISSTENQTSPTDIFSSDEIKTENLLPIEMQIYILQVLVEDWPQANRFAITALEKIQDGNFEDSKEAYSKALAKMQLAKNKIKACISSPNLIESKFNEIEEEYNKIIRWLDEPEENLMKVMETEIFIVEKEGNLINALQCFNNLYCIREYDNLPEDEAANSLEDYWMDFQFAEAIECPETIKEEELYLIWAKQFSNDFVKSEEFMAQLQSLRENDDMSSKECNAAWAQFMESFLFSSYQDEAAFAVSLII